MADTRRRCCRPTPCKASFHEADRTDVTLIKGRALNSNYPALDFGVHDLLERWDTVDTARIRQAITESIQGSSRTIVFLGLYTHESQWVAEEVRMTIEAGKPVKAIHLEGKYGQTPCCLSENAIPIYAWSEATLQQLVTE